MNFDLYKFDFTPLDTIRDVYSKYFKVLPEYIPSSQVKKQKNLMNKLFKEEIGDLGDKFFHLHNLKGDDFKSAALEILEDL